MSIKNQWLALPVQFIVGKKYSNITGILGKKIRFLCFAYIVGFGYTVGLVFADRGRHSLLAFMLDMFLLSSMIIIPIIVRWTGSTKIFFHGTVLILAITIHSDYFSPTGARSVFLLPLILILAYFLLGRLSGLFWSLTLLFVNLALLNLINLNAVKLTVNSQSLAYATLAAGLVSAFLFIYEGVNVANEKKIAIRDKRLRAINEKLQQELGKRYELTVELRSQLDETNKANKQLELARKTLTDSLNDTTQLKEQLARQKANVERQVELRTVQLQEEQSRLAASIMTLELGYLMTLPDGQVLSHNPALTKICGLDKNISNLELLEQLSNKISNYDLIESIRQCAKSGNSFEKTDISIAEKNLRILGSAIKLSSSDQVIGVVLLFEDLTAAKLLQRSEDEFVAIASHELRTPLTIIEGNISILKELFTDQINDPQLQRVVDDVSASARRMIMIVNQFMTMTRLEQKKNLYKFEPVNLKNLINKAIANNADEASKKNNTINFNDQINLSEVKADAECLQQVLENLINNAVKFTDHGNITIMLQQSEKNVKILISDTGKGMSLQNQALLFRKFQQATDNILTRNDSQSTGLGLYISKLFIEQMGGQIELVSSEIGHGSTFAVSLNKSFL